MNSSLLPVISALIGGHGTMQDEQLAFDADDEASRQELKEPAAAIIIVLLFLLIPMHFVYFVVKDSPVMPYGEHAVRYRHR